jgi:hypothetical protein
MISWSLVGVSLSSSVPLVRREANLAAYSCGVIHQVFKFLVRCDIRDWLTGQPAVTTGKPVFAVPKIFAVCFFERTTKSLIVVRFL